APACDMPSDLESARTELTKVDGVTE
ncbi:MAG: hypothetical protein RLY41_456, partial [Pseudomonadota bacterium]